MLRSGACLGTRYSQVRAWTDGTLELCLYFPVLLVCAESQGAGRGEEDAARTGETFLVIFLVLLVSCARRWRVRSHLDCYSAGFGNVGAALFSRSRSRRYRHKNRDYCNRRRMISAPVVIYGAHLPRHTVRDTDRARAIGTAGEIHHELAEPLCSQEHHQTLDTDQLRHVVKGFQPDPAWAGG